MLFRFLSSFLKTGITSARFVVDENWENVIASLKLEVRNLLKLSILYLFVAKGISYFWHASFSLRFLSIFWVFLLHEVEGKRYERKLLIPNFRNTWMIFIFCISVYYWTRRNNVTIWSKLPVLIHLFRFGTALAKNSQKVSESFLSSGVISSGTIRLVWICFVFLVLSDKENFTLLQKFLLSITLIYEIYFNTAFLLF